MGCDVLVSSSDRLHEVQRLFEERDRRFSRFYDHSELNHVNAHPFGVTLVSEELASMLSLALDAAHATGGLVTAAAGGALVGAGYDRDFASLPLDGDAVESAPVPSLLSLRLRGRMLLRTEPVVLDLNGVVKSKTVDDALALLGDGWVSAGGDVATTVPLDVGLPGGGSIRLDRGGLATSSVAKRTLAPRRRAAAPFDRSGHRSTGAHALARRHRGRPRLRRGRHRREGCAPPGAGRAVMARPARPRGALRRPSRRSPTDADLAAVRA